MTLFPLFVTEHIRRVQSGCVVDLISNGKYRRHQKYKRIGVIATLSTTLEPTADLIQRRAALAGKKIELTSKLCEGAFEALMSGDGATHDAKVAAALKELSQQVDVIVLAQASMARGRTTPVGVMLAHHQ